MDSIIYIFTLPTFITICFITCMCLIRILLYMAYLFDTSFKILCNTHYTMYRVHACASVDISDLQAYAQSLQVLYLLQLQRFHGSDNAPTKLFTYQLYLDQGASGMKKLVQLEHVLFINTITSPCSDHYTCTSICCHT